MGHWELIVKENRKRVNGGVREARKARQAKEARLNYVDFGRSEGAGWRKKRSVMPIPGLK